MANALMEGTAITDLFFRCYSFSTGECAAIMTNGLASNTSVVSILMVLPCVALIDALATALPSNSTLRKLSFRPYSVIHLSPVFLALGKNQGLKTLIVDGGFGSIDESLCKAIQNALGMNTTLESLKLERVHPTDGNADLWCRALSFLRTNKALKSLMVTMAQNVRQSHAVAFRSDIAAMLQENASLESLSILGSWIGFKAA
jgi:hypothetical protein